jgi:hypothetical protein
VSVGQMPVGQMPVGQMPVRQMPVGQMPVGQIVFNQNAWSTFLCKETFKLLITSLTTNDVIKS